MAWHTFELDSKLISGVLTSGTGYYQRERKFITLPKNERYDEGYGFYISACLAGKISISIPDDLKLEIQMSPEERVPGKRYKRYRLNGKEIKESVFFPYQQEQAEREKERECERQRRNKGVLGNIVCGHYYGNSYGGNPDGDYAAFFWNGVRYYNPNHQKVQNVKVAFQIIEGVSQHFFDDSIELIDSRLEVYHSVNDSLKILKGIENPSESLRNIARLLEKERDGTIEQLQAELAKVLSEQKDE